METDYRGNPNTNPANFSFQKQNSSAILLGSSANNAQVPMPMYNSFFLGTSQPSYGYQNAPTFLYKERKGKVNWRNIANLDVDEMIARGDVKALENYLSNITFANIEKDDIEKFGDATLLKLFRLSQYGLEYLLNSQNYLANQAYVLDTQYKHAENKLGPIEELLRKNHAEIQNLKTEVKEKKDLIKTYKKTLNKPVFKCHLCSKYFQSSEYLDSHFKRKHPGTPQAEKNEKIIVREIATSPLLPQQQQTREVNVKAAGRYNKGSFHEDDELDNTQNRNSRMENGAQTQTTADNTMQMQSSVFFERLVQQFKEDEDMKLSQLNLTIQEKFQEIIRTNKELTSKVAEMEKKIENQNQNFASPMKESDTFARTIKTTADARRQNEESLREFQKKETPKKPILRGHQELDVIGENVERENTKTLESEDLDTPNLGSKPDHHHARYPISGHKQFMNQNPPIDIQQETQPVYRVQEVQEDARGQDREEVVHQEKVHEEKRVENVLPTQETHTTKMETSARTQTFHASSLRDISEEKEVEKVQEFEQPVNKVATIKAKDIKKTKQAFKSGDLEDFQDDEVEVIKKSNAPMVKSANHQVFKSGALESLQDLDDVVGKVHKGTKNLNSKFLEDDDDSRLGYKGRKASQEDFVIMEKSEEEDGIDDVREKHKSYTKKAENLIKSKYAKGYTKQEEQEARAHVEKQVDNLCQREFRMPMSELPKQSEGQLKGMLADLQAMNRKDNQIMQGIMKDYKNVPRSEVSSVAQSINKERSSQDTAKIDFKESPRPTQSVIKNNIPPMQSSELRNLLMNPETTQKKSSDVLVSQDLFSGRKPQVFDSQNLEQQLISVEDFKPSRLKGDVRESGGNLIKKSIEPGMLQEI